MLQLSDRTWFFGRAYFSSRIGPYALFAQFSVFILEWVFEIVFQNQTLLKNQKLSSNWGNSALLHFFSILLNSIILIICVLQEHVIALGICMNRHIL